MKPALVEVTWLDACSHHGWYTDDELPTATLMEMKTVGYVVRRRKKDIALAQAHSPEKWGEIWVIPIACVSRVRRLR